MSRLADDMVAWDEEFRPAVVDSRALQWEARLETSLVARVEVVDALGVRH